MAIQGGVWELYDMDTDPTELNDLVAAKPEVATQLVGKWAEWAERVGVEKIEEFSNLTSK